MKKIINNINWKSPIFSAVITTLVLSAVFAVFNKNFLTFANFTTIFLNASIIGIFSTGMTMLLISGNVDLTAAATSAFSSMVMGMLWKAGMPFGLAIPLGIASGLVLGLWNGILVAKGQLPSMMVGVGNMLTFRALAYAISGNQTITVTDNMFAALGRKYLLGIPVSVYYMIIIFLIMGYILEHTAFGRRVYAVGGNMQASYYSGLNIDRTIIQSFVIMGGISALAGIVSTAQTSAAAPKLFFGREFDFISPCVIGGISMSGGKGKMIGTFIGCILMAIVANGMVLAGLQSYWQDMVRGLILIFAMFVDAMRNRRDLA